MRHANRTSAKRPVQNTTTQLGVCTGESKAGCLYFCAPLAEAQPEECHHCGTERFWLILDKHPVPVCLNCVRHGAARPGVRFVRPTAVQIASNPCRT